ncbi:MAG: aminobenzoyl-glutamate utilization protein B [Natronomonas sp.]|jgi:aminobenzoyl-glutamate utilization protein B
MTDLAFENMQAVGPPEFAEADKEFVRELLENAGYGEIEEPMNESLSEPDPSVTNDFLGGADDINEFCWHAPTCRVYTAYVSPVQDYGSSSWVSAALANTDVAHTALLKAAEVMSTTAIELLTDPERLAEAQAEFERPKSERSIPVLLSEDAEPPVDETVPPFYPEDREPPTNIG